MFGCPRLCLLGRLLCLCMLAIWLSLLCALGFVPRALLMASHAGGCLGGCLHSCKKSSTHPPFFSSLGLQLMQLLACWAWSMPCWECIVPNASCLTELLKELVRGRLPPCSHTLLPRFLRGSARQSPLSRGMGRTCPAVSHGRGVIIFECRVLWTGPFAAWTDTLASRNDAFVA